MFSALSQTAAKIPSLAIFGMKSWLTPFPANVSSAFSITICLSTVSPAEKKQLLGYTAVQ